MMFLFENISEAAAGQAKCEGPRRIGHSALRRIGVKDNGKGDDRLGPRSALRVTMILETLAEHRTGITLSTLSDVLNAPKTSLLALLRVLEGSGYIVVKDFRYFLGPFGYRLGALISSTYEAANVFQSALRDLSLKTQETVMLGFLDRYSKLCSYLEVVQPDIPVRYVPSIGARRPLYCTAAGRAFLFFLGDDFLEDYLATTDLVRHSPRTATSKAELRTLARKARSLGYAVNMGETNTTTGAVSAPIYDRAMTIQYCVIVAGPFDRIREQLKTVSSRTLAAGRDMSSKLGYTGAYPLLSPAVSDDIPERRQSR
jgi:DNA-binding IclR family transcriptional regulator